MGRRTHRWSAWLLPFLVGRLLVPTGFMLSVSGDGLGIDLCPGYAPVPVSTAAATGHAGVDHGHHAAPDGSHDRAGQAPAEPADNGPAKCPFMLAGGSAACPPAESAREPARVADAASALCPHPDWISPAVLIDRIRGPPIA